MNLPLLIRIGGVLQLGVLTASALVPRVLDWRGRLRRLELLVRQLFWVYGGYIVLMITALGLLSLTQADTLADGSTLARSLTGFCALFWGIRLALQLFVFDSRKYRTHWFLQLGHHGLTATFTYLVVVFTLATLH